MAVKTVDNTVLLDTYGPDSTRYEQAGGTRSSERKPSSRKAKAVTA